MTSIFIKLRHFLLLQVKIWFQNRRAKERKINKKKLQQPASSTTTPNPPTGSNGSGGGGGLQGNSGSGVTMVTSSSSSNGLVSPSSLSLNIKEEYWGGGGGGGGGGGYLFGCWCHGTGPLSNPPPGVGALKLLASDPAALFPLAKKKLLEIMRKMSHCQPQYFSHQTLSPNRDAMFKISLQRDVQPLITAKWKTGGSQGNWGKKWGKKVYFCACQMKIFYLLNFLH